MVKNKVKTSFTLNPKIKHLVDILANKLQISKTAIITLAILDLAEKHKVEESETV